MRNPTTLAHMIREALEAKSPGSLHHFIRGAEGDSGGTTEGTGSGTATSPSTPPPGQVSDGTEVEENGDDPSGSTRDSYTREEMEKTRREAAKYRVRAQEAEAKAQTYEREKMSEADRAKAEAQDARKEAEAARSEITKLKVENAIIAAAATAKFSDPADAVRLIDTSDINLNDDGTPNANSLSAAIIKLSKAKPYLVTPVGSGDGGAYGATPSDRELQDRAAAHAASIQQRGGIRISS